MSEDMLRAAFPDGIPGEGVGDQGVMVDLTEDDGDVKEEVKQEE